MRLLVLGGTRFLGRATAAHAVAAGHQVTCAARGTSGPVATGAELVRVDRSVPDGLAPLDGRSFDAVVDVSSVPSQVRQAVTALAGRVGHWTCVSTISVYADLSAPGGRPDNTPVLPAAPPEMDDPTAGDEEYGRCCVACEQAVTGSGRPALVCRPGLIVGLGDPSDRFTYWPVRFARPDRPVLPPGRPDDPVQWIDVRDLAGWLVRSAEAGLTGTYEATGAPVPRAEFLAGIATGVGGAPELVWVDPQFLLDHGVQPWSGPRSLPLWLPLPEYSGMLSRDIGPAVSAGLTFRQLADTARDTLAWYTVRGDSNLKSGLAAADEADVLEAWRKSQG